LKLGEKEGKRSHVACEEKNNGKTKKNEASLIKRLLRINSQPFVSSYLEISLYSLSLSHSWTLIVFLEQFNIGSRKEKKEKGQKEQARKNRIKWLQWDYF